MSHVHPRLYLTFISVLTFALLVIPYGMSPH